MQSVALAFISPLPSLLDPEPEPAFASLPFLSGNYNKDLLDKVMEMADGIEVEDLPQFTTRTSKLRQKIHHIFIISDDNFPITTSLSRRKKHTHTRKTPGMEPNSHIMDVKCPGCYKIITVFSHAQFCVLAAALSSLA
ncbi:CDKN2AIP N-terminal-like protein [Myotis davidii]|uniref:CDKN2AIP N-terminal-like protein n=1 Tax=Myotis davidii TaxID=225400 RepID=L5MI26_MYODS|nr:CDKN2AIP N-terminal-like protein [Myotis davidii]